MGSRQAIEQLIPHREPFLWVDRIVAVSAEAIETEKDIPVDLAIFAGHYPGNPIMPGVLLCEAVFQSGSLLIAKHLGAKLDAVVMAPVLTRILGAKFKRPVRPGETIRILVKLTEQVGPAWFMSGTVLVDSKVAVKVDFACALAGLSVSEVSA